jgi:hypothetical protein
VKQIIKESAYDILQKNQEIQIPVVRNGGLVFRSGSPVVGSGCPVVRRGSPVVRSSSPVRSVAAKGPE